MQEDPKPYIYRKRKAERIWHFCTNCSKWPTGKFDCDEREIKVTTSNLCEECKSLEAEGKCLNNP